jgi:hypothetical protein
LTRREWERVARDTGAPYVNIEVVCSDLREHQKRVETRRSTVPGLTLPTWREVTARQFDDWTVDRVVVDTFGRSEQETLDELLAKIPLSRRCTPDVSLIPEAPTNPSAQQHVRRGTDVAT